MLFRSLSAITAVLTGAGVEVATGVGSGIPSERVRKKAELIIAPTARNLRPFVFKYKDGQVSASITTPTETAMIDLGIAKLHFELGAGGGSWEYGNGGHYYFDDKRKESDK